jgi:enamine deaminase RidA (YjgF/YER057c/UK114 family)
MSTYSNPAGVSGPFGMYSHSCGVPANSRWLLLAGQVGTDSTGNTPESVEEQCRITFANLKTCLQAGGMEFKDLVKLTVFLMSRDDLPSYRIAREEALGEIKPPTTLIIISGLAKPIWKVEIEAFAAKQD